MKRWEIALYCAVLFALWCIANSPSAALGGA
ncbi:hypothetical protein SEA_JDAWG_3 [Microbacterium phage JDawG]|nr:hypothetical protein SEA_JDAWG_3 [Microbacterium phage JDawG]